MRRFISLLIVIALAILPAAAQEAFDLQAQSDTACQALLTGDYARIISMLNETAAAQLSEDILSQTMSALSVQFGTFSAVSGAEYLAEQNVSAYTLVFENGALLLSFGFDADGKIAALTLTPAAAPATPSERPLPEGVQEIPVTLYPDSDRSLKGTVLVPSNAGADTPYVVFIHGSGPSDMDQTVGGNKMFRDIACDLAALGVGSIRYDKITYSHPELFTGNITIDDEYLEPVSEAVRILKENVPSANIYALGHSLGGMLTPYLVRECGLSGGIALAGTPLPLWQMSYDQNMMLIDAMPADQQPALIAQVEAEREIALSLTGMTDEEAASISVFGINGLYQKSISHLDEAAIAEETGKPFLFVWGDKDVQVNQAAFDAWQETLSEAGPYTYITYPGLNHMFLPHQEGDSIANVQAAYARPASVAEYVSADIAAWISANP